MYPRAELNFRISATYNEIFAVGRIVADLNSLQVDESGVWADGADALYYEILLNIKN
jgi:hypothetical protein